MMQMMPDDTDDPDRSVTDIGQTDGRTTNIIDFWRPLYAKGPKGQKRNQNQQNSFTIHNKKNSKLQLLGDRT